jgi:hypothetical protein
MTMRNGRPLRPLPEWLIVDDADRARCAEKNWSVDSTGYATTCVREDDGTWRRIRAQEFILGRAPAGHVADHVNGNKLDNRRENLRHVRHHENLHNAGANRKSKTGVRGVYWFPLRNKFVARFFVQGKLRHVGYFDSVEAAEEAIAEARECWLPGVRVTA